ncbi:uncharacterized protein LOC100368927 [Saccoglossus kowalevskii]|uniref:Nucleoporin NUP42 n=1 Tax=Saccoglossus kowalevskii TaxID=10224 RepID=A0ABM0GLI6_SACKO|nr:PREDICTED: uncharacterized protein LOC100368927 [Saccoglossus kowalevskii]
MHDESTERSSAAPSASGTEKGACKFFTAGKRCRYGERCRWRHADSKTAVVEVSQVSVSIPPTTSNDEKNGIIEDISIGNPSVAKSTKNKLRVTQRSSNQDEKVCTFFQKHHHCRFGFRCRFVHVVPINEAIGPARSNNNHSKLEKKTPCKFFKSSASCRAGENCPYFHDSPEEHSKLLQEDVPQIEKNIKTVSKTLNHDQKSQGKPKKLCRYFARGNCSMGPQCKFRHPQNLIEDDPISSIDGVVPAPAKLHRPKVVRPTVNLKLSQLPEAELQKLRTTEIEQLKKRFRNEKFDVVEDENMTIYKVVFSPTDPDWPFDVRDFDISASFPATYPKEQLSAKFKMEYLPDIVLRHMNTEVEDWIMQRHNDNIKQDKVDLMFRPFLRWLDRNLESMFTNAARKYKMEVVAKAAGFEFIPSDHLATSDEKAVMPEGEPTDRKDEGLTVLRKSGFKADNDMESQELIKMEDLQIKQREIDEDEDKERSDSKQLNEHRGTEIKLRGLELTENTATMNCTKLSISIQCVKCKGKWDITTPAHRLNSVLCNRCQTQQLVTFRPSIMHQYSSVMGYLDLEGCIPFDLISILCDFNAGCFNCSKEMAFTGLHFGQAKTLWCKHCHKKMKLVADAVKFLQLQQSKVSGKAHVIEVKKPKKVSKDPAIQEGKPLPLNGTCKHYKKSFRWLRFPCCGKAYPCDECHNAEETDHEMKLATRMICGHCCKEQPYSSEKPCISCSNAMTKSRSVHWEGGQGCRNKVTMSKNDKQKYTSSSKTTSRKQQSKQHPKKKSKS